MSVQLSSTIASSCVLTPLAALRVNVLLALPNTIRPASVSGGGKDPLWEVAVPLSSAVGIRQNSRGKKKTMGVHVCVYVHVNMHM